MFFKFVLTALVKPDTFCYIRKLQIMYTLFNISCLMSETCWLGWCSWYSDWLWAGWSRDWIPVGARSLAHIQTGHGASYTLCTRSFPGIKGPGRGINHPPHLMPMLKKVKSYTSTTHVCIHGGLQGELYFSL